tara:strand:- start:2803 stop:3201 length:399 start_codon:yes stop_codon:yes gene_type:complete
MKKIIVLLLLGCFAHIAAASELEGVWELVSGEYVDAEGKLVAYESVDLQSMKIISTSYFSFTSVKGDQFWASGSGTYQLTSGQYKEVLKYNSFGQSPGAEFVFKTKIDGDYWYNSRWEGDTRVEYEVWRRVE